MKDFAALLCTEDPVDAAASILDCMMDLITTTFDALMKADADNAERLASEATTALMILHSCADRVYVGVEELQRDAKRGFWRERRE